MLDKKLKEQIYYGNTQQKKDFDNKAFYILVAVILGFALIFAVISINSNKTTHYELPKQERNLSNIVEKQSTEEKSETEAKIYTEAEIQADIKSYKNKFISKIKPNWHPERESFLIDNNSLEVKIDKYGSVTFPEFDKIGFSDANTNIMKYTIEESKPFDPLPESYNNVTLTFRVYFEGNTESYWGNAQPKSSYQVSLSPIKNVTKPKQTTNQTSSNNSMDEFHKINNTHASNNNNSLYGEFGSFVNDKTPQRTQNVIKQTVNKSSNNEIN